MPPIRSRRPRAALHALVLLAAAGCAQVPIPEAGALLTGAEALFAAGMPRTERLDRALAPTPKPAAPLTGTVRARDLLTGETLTLSVSRQGHAVHVRQSDGCRWTRRGDWFAPSARWSGCGENGRWQSGSATLRTVASIWPLKPGAGARYTRQAVSHTGRRYTRETTCRVTGQEAVLREDGRRTPAHVVACTDGKRTRTTWFAPGEGPVAFRQRHAETGVEAAWVRL